MGPEPKGLTPGYSLGLLHISPNSAGNPNDHRGHRRFITQPLDSLVSLGRRVRVQRIGEWEAMSRGFALITGASSGIGAAFARKLARMGHGVILVARRRDRLETLAGELGKQFGVDTEVVAADLANPTDLETVEQLVRQHPNLEYLVNNAGFGTGGRFPKVALTRNLDMLRVHCEAAVRLCHAAIPDMIAAKHGAIINVSSVAGLLRVPGSAMYCSTKTFLNAFSESLSMELRNTGVKVQALCPGFTYTEFHDTPDLADTFNRSDIPSFLWLSADRVVDMSFRGLKRNQVICVTGLRYKTLIAILRIPWMRPLIRRASRRRQQG